MHTVTVVVVSIVLNEPKTANWQGTNENNANNAQNEQNENQHNFDVAFEHDIANALGIANNRVGIVSDGLTSNGQNGKPSQLVMVVFAILPDTGMCVRLCVLACVRVSLYVSLSLCLCCVSSVSLRVSHACVCPDGTNVSPSIVQNLLQQQLAIAGSPLLSGVYVCVCVFL